MADSSAKRSGVSSAAPVDLLGIGLRLGDRRLAVLRALRAPERDGLLEIGGALGRARLDVGQDRHRDQVIAVVEPDAAHAVGVAALEQAHVLGRQSGCLAVGGRQQHVVGCRPADRDVDDAVALVELHGDLAVAVDALEIGERSCGGRCPRASRTSARAGPRSSRPPAAAGSR